MKNLLTQTYIYSMGTGFLSSNFFCSQIHFDESNKNENKRRKKITCDDHQVYARAVLPYHSGSIIIIVPCGCFY